MLTLVGSRWACYAIGHIDSKESTAAAGNGNDCAVTVQPRRLVILRPLGNIVR